MPRQDAEEWIDHPDTAPHDICETLRDQAWVNRWLGGANAVLSHARPVLRTCSANPIRVLDLACGGADISRWIADETRRLGKNVDIIALDRSESVLQYARGACSNYREISFVRADALAPPLASAGFDLVILATCLHHLQPGEAVSLLRIANELSRGTVVAADLVRSPLASGAFEVLARLFRFRPVSIHDGAISVRRSYTPPELATLARKAGLDNFSLYRHPFYRMALVYQQRSDSHA
jgi:SAM-dependent methyltransferase